MLYWSGTTEELKVYKIPGQEEICPMEKYLDIVKDVLPTDEEAQHKWDHLSKEDLRQLYEERLNLN